MNNFDLSLIISRIFPRLIDEKRSLAILSDFPEQTADNDAWKKRRELAFDWYAELRVQENDLDSVELFFYPDIGINNGDLPEKFYLVDDNLPQRKAELVVLPSVSQEELFSTRKLFIALTEFSATAPLKNLAKKFFFRAATMPGFNEKMLSACNLDYQKVRQRTKVLKEKLDQADYAFIRFVVDKADQFDLRVDLRFREAQISSGVFDQAGMVGNFPSGETYIVPYEGEKGESSTSAGTLPVQIGNQIIFYEIEQNIARRVSGRGEIAESEQNFLEAEPAYGNIAELGLGVLREFGIKPIGEILLDEKLGLHIAFGRSDHFGGMIGPEHFHNRNRVIHLDRIFIPEIQPRISVQELTLYSATQKETIISNDRYTLFNS